MWPSRCLCTPASIIPSQHGVSLLKSQSPTGCFYEPQPQHKKFAMFKSHWNPWGRLVTTKSSPFDVQFDTNKTNQVPLPPLALGGYLHVICICKAISPNIIHFMLFLLMPVHFFCTLSPNKYVFVHVTSLKKCIPKILRSAKDSFADCFRKCKLCWFAF